MDYSNYLLLCVLSLLAIAPVSGGDGDQQPVARIINGQDSGYVPHAARITGFSMEYSTIGSGTFVTLRHLITAADIVRNMTIFYVDYGNESMGAAKTLSGLGFTHPDYDPVTFKNDIAIVIVNSDTDPSVVVPMSLPLATGAGGSIPAVGDLGMAAGFGMKPDETRGWVLNFDMQSGYFKVIDDRQCRTMLYEQQDVIASTHFCTDNEDSLCYGDIGKGLIVEVGGVETLVGVVSVITNLCRVMYPVMHTRVDLYIDWILENIQEEE